MSESKITPDVVTRLRRIVSKAGGEFDGVQDAIRPAFPEIIFETITDLQVFSLPFDPDRIDEEDLVLRIQQEIAKFRRIKGSKKMTLNEKLHKIYEAVDHIEKLGFNKQQNYNFIRSADVTHAIRKQFTDLKVYAEINFEFVGLPYTIARAKEPNAPFSAVNVKCSILFHDLESPETATGSGLGSGADTGDKAAYKAQTGALKYALKNAFLVPDEADPEADPSVDEDTTTTTTQRNAPDDMPDFQEARHEAPRPAAAPRAQKPVERPTAAAVAKTEPVPTPAENSAVSAAVAEAVQEAAPEHGDAYEYDPRDGAQPTEEELTVYRTKFSKLGDDLSDKGKLKSSKGLPINRKLLVFLLAVTKAVDAKDITKAQWDDFFVRVDKAKALETGLVGLAQLVNKANGIEDPKKAK